jgi:aldehyde dehydrogenase (NAD+)
MKEILSRLGLEAENSGAWIGGRPLACKDGQLIESVNPATGELIARVRTAGVEEYEAVMRAAREAFHAWRILPAPQRGEAVRLAGEALRRHKDDLGSLVTLEMGKIKAEGDGEVQEMIDIADFAVGQSRMLYGNTMHSERPGHRMYEQWHPLGVVGIISAFNFPVAVWSWNAFIAAVCGDISVWKPSPKTPLTAIAVQKICNEALAPLDLPPIFSLFIESDVALAERFVDDPRVDLVSSAATTRSSSTKTPTSIWPYPRLSSVLSVPPDSAARRRAGFSSTKRSSRQSLCDSVTHMTRSASATRWLRTPLWVP